MRHLKNSNTRAVKCGTRPVKGITSARHWVNSYNFSAAAAKSVSHMVFWWCIYITIFRKQIKGSLTPGDTSIIHNAMRHNNTRLGIIADAPGLCNSTDCLRDAYHLVWRRRVLGSVGDVSAMRNTRRFLIETIFISNAFVSLFTVRFFRISVLLALAQALTIALSCRCKETSLKVLKWGKVSSM